LVLAGLVVVMDTAPMDKHQFLMQQVLVLLQEESLLLVAGVALEDLQLQQKLVILEDLGAEVKILALALLILLLLEDLEYLVKVMQVLVGVLELEVGRASPLTELRQISLIPVMVEMVLLQTLPAPV
jgi:hypothetical protein